MAMAVSPGRTVTLFDFVEPVGNLQVTEYVPARRVRRTEPDFPFEAPFTLNAHGPPAQTATSVPFAAGGGGGGLATSPPPVVPPRTGSSPPPVGGGGGGAAATDEEADAD